MQTVTVEAEIREPLSQGNINSLRRAGYLPAILYGGARTKKNVAENTLLKVNEKSFMKMLNKEGSNVLLELKLGSEKTNAVIKELQRDYITRKLIHIDFQRVDMTKKLEVMVPIHLSGEAPGVKLHGGILEHITRELKVICLPKDIPHQIDVDISKLEVGDGLTVADIPAKEGLQVLTDPHQLVANVVAPTILEEPTVAEAVPGATEPEVIAKGKKLEEGEEGAVAAPAKGAAAGAKPGAAASAKPGAAPAKGGAAPAAGAKPGAPPAKGGAPQK